MDQVTRSQVIRSEVVADGVRLVTLDRPDSLNALDASLVMGMHDLLDGLARDDTTRVVVLTGAGRAFCAGADLRAGQFPVGFDAGPQRTWFEIQKWYSGLVLKLRRLPQPIVAAVNGPCAGGGFSIAMACDVRVVDRDAFFLAAQVNIGQAASEMGATYLLPRLVGMGRASEILMTGRRVAADEAERIGLANVVAEPGTSVPAAIELAGRIASKAPLAIRLTKEAFDSSAVAGSLELALAAEDRSQTLCVLTDDLAEGQAAWMEGRPPSYRG